MVDIDMETLVKCNNCKAAFANTDKLKEHYRGEWHVLNSKRRANGLLPLKRDEFKLLQASKLNQENKISVVGKKDTPKVNDEVLPKPPKSSTQSSPYGKKSLQENEKNVESEDEGEWLDVDEDGNTLPPALTIPKIAPNISIFDDKEFKNTEDCLQYMSQQFGFFIPDIEYLVDMDGLLTYLGEKVKLGGYCLYCQKLHRPGHPTQQHMISKSHCKILYDGDVDGDEYEDFYDFSAQYQNDGEVEYDEDGNIIEREMTISAIGELILPSGKTVGHRDFRKYYKQYHKPLDDREPILAQQREELLRLGAICSSPMLVDEVMALSNLDVMTNLIKYQRAIRKNQIVEQRASQRAEQISKRKEVRSNTWKLRAGENTTMKIRDYHSRLM